MPETARNDSKGHVYCRDGFECDLFSMKGGKVLFKNMKLHGKPIMVNGEASPPMAMTVKDAMHELQKTHGGIVDAPVEKPEEEEDYFDSYEKEPGEDELETGDDETYEELDDSSVEDVENKKDILDYVEDFEDPDSFEDAEVREADMPDEGQEDFEEEQDNPEDETEYETEEEPAEIDNEPEEEPAAEPEPESEPKPKQQEKPAAKPSAPDMKNERRYLSIMAQEFGNTIRNNGGSVINSDVTIEGNLSAKGNIEMAGSIAGDIKTDGDLIVTGTVDGNINAVQIMLSGASVTGDVITAETTQVIDKATIVGDIKARNAVVEGNVKGNITCEESAKIKNGAVVYGNIKAKSIQIEEGVKTVGTVEVLGGDDNLDALFPNKRDKGKGVKEHKDAESFFEEQAAETK